MDAVERQGRLWAMVMIRPNLFLFSTISRYNSQRSGLERRTGTRTLQTSNNGLGSTRVTRQSLIQWSHGFPVLLCTSSNQNIQTCQPFPSCAGTDLFTSRIITHPHPHPHNHHHGHHAFVQVAMMPQSYHSTFPGSHFSGVSHLSVSLYVLLVSKPPDA